MTLDFIAEGESLKGNAEVQDLINLIESQIKNPFETSTNYYKQLIELLEDDEDFLEEISRDILHRICEAYDIKLDENEIEDFDEVIEATKSMYKFFVKNAKELVYIFLINFLKSGKNRKNLISNYDIKGNFSKDTYGKKENYILIQKLKDIIRDIQSLEVPISSFLDIIKDADEDRAYMDFIKEGDDNNVITSDTAIKKMIKGFRKSDSYGKLVNKLTIDLFREVINPSLKQIGIDPKETLIFNCDSAIEVSDDENIAE